MLKLKTLQTILSKLIIIFPVLLIVSLISNDRTHNITPLLNVIDSLLLPSLAGMILSAILLKVVNKKRARLLN
jgi:predicted Na+-dependent transporter